MKVKFKEINTGVDMNPLTHKTQQMVFPVYTENISKLKDKFSDDIVVEPMTGNGTIEVDMDSITQYLKDYNQSLKSCADYIFFYQVQDENFTEEFLNTLFYARFTGKKVIIFHDKTDFSKAKSAMFIVPSKHLELQKYLREIQNSAKTRCGLLPYEDKYTLNFSFAKLLVIDEKNDNNRHMLVNRISAKEDIVQKWTTESEEFYYFPKKSANLENLTELLFKSGRFLEFNYISHCRHCTLFFDDFYFCGWREKSDDDEMIRDKNHLPCCYYDPKQCSIENRKKRKASDLNADIMFLNGCNLGDLNESILPYRFNLVPNLIYNHAVSIITSPSIKVGSEAENIFAYNLLKYGYTEGEKVYYINRFMEKSTIEDSLFYLIGDPCLKGKREGQKPVSMKSKFTDTQMFQVEVSNIEGHTMLDVDIPYGDVVYPYIFNLRIIADDKEAKPETEHIYFFPHNEEGNSRLFLFSNRTFHKGKIVIDFARTDEIHNTIDKLKEHVKNLVFYRNNFVLPNSVKGWIEDFQNNSKRVYTLQKECRYNVKAFFAMKKFLNKMEARALYLYKEIFSAITEYTLNKKDNYYERISEKRVPVKNSMTKSSCISCGKEEYVYPYKIFTFEHEYFRSSLKCLGCGIIRDTPDDKLKFFDYGNSKFEAGGTECEIVKIVNQHDYEIDVSISPICLTSEKIDVEPSSCTVRLKPNEGHIFKFKITPNSDILKHFYLFSFYVVGDGKFYYYSKMLSHV